MCGIYGFVGDCPPGLLPAMDRSIHHRGPDDSGVFSDRSCSLGMRRLSIIDLDGGRQPITNEDGSVVVVFNGEIYNYRSLRKDLEARGHRFSTHTDTECLVHLYEDRGRDLVHSLDGMFAFAIWDQKKQSLLLARDRFGQKPLYYSQIDGGFIFASELKALLCHPQLPRKISERALSHYLSFGVTPEDEAILDGVRKLPPAHLLTLEAGQLRERRYWDLRPSPREVSEGEAIEEVQFLVRDAVRSHLVADVPVGAFLSGGIDSATIVGNMVALGAHPKTFSIGFDDPQFDELKWARIIAGKFHTDHHELVVRPDAWALAEELVWYLDEPFADVSAIPTYLVSKLAAEEVKVVLSGDGGDEVFAGYDRYPLELRESKFDGAPRLARSLLGTIAATLPDRARGKNWLRHASLDPRFRFVDGQSVFPADLKARLSPLDDSPLHERAALFGGAPGDQLSRLLYLDTMTYLPLDILTKVDRMTMAHSLEARPPLLDHHLVEAVFSLPSSLKLRGARQKHVLKEAMKGLVPDEILNRGKWGFGVPIRRWFRGPLRDSVIEVLCDRKTRERGLTHHPFVRALIEEHLSGRRDQSVRMWALVMLELWCRRVIDPPLAHLEERAYA
jgi:asparagine synthase (glutamine-hydrolysing)